MIEFNELERALLALQQAEDALQQAEEYFDNRLDEHPDEDVEELYLLLTAALRNLRDAIGADD